MFDYLTKTSFINLKQFTVDSINYIGWELNLSIRPKNTVYTVSMNTNQWERLSWKMTYSMILANNTKWVSIQLFGCGRAKLGSLGRGHFHHLFITELLLVQPVVHIDPHITDKVTKPSQVPWTGNLQTWMWHLNLQSHS